MKELHGLGTDIRIILWDLINEAEKRLSPPQVRLWEVIRVLPHKWIEKPYGTSGGGFCVVAIIGNSVIWYNDIENGFNNSKYHEDGTIDEYWCNQDEPSESLCIIARWAKSDKAANIVSNLSTTAR